MKKLIAMLLVLVILFTMTGCASMMEKEYYEMSDYNDVTVETGEDISGSIKTYNGLLRAINKMVRNHETEGRLTFSNYDGDISADLGNACWQVKSETALGAFAVDYMSYDVSRIVSYYEADIYITYKRPKTQTDAVLPVSSPTYVRGYVQDAVKTGNAYLLLELTTMLINEEAINGYVKETYENNLLRVIAMPKVDVTIYPDSGSDKLFEISLDYGFEPDELDAMRTDLSNVVATLVEQIRADQTESWLRNACSTVAGVTQYDPNADTRMAVFGEDSGLGSTAYGALVDNMADSQGFAMALKLLCSLRDIDCRIVEGSQNKEPHWWNIIKLDGAYYHVDLSQWKARGAGVVYLKSDTDMQNAGYWWDVNSSPACEATFNTTKTETDDQQVVSGMADTTEPQTEENAAQSAASYENVENKA